MPILAVTVNGGACESEKRVHHDSTADASGIDYEVRTEAHGDGAARPETPPVLGRHHVCRDVTRARCYICVCVVAMAEWRRKEQTAHGVADAARAPELICGRKDREAHRGRWTGPVLPRHPRHRGARI